MLANRLMSVLKASSAVIFAWSTTLKTNIGLSSANTIATPTNAPANICSDTDLTGSIYCEVSCTNLTSGLYYTLGLMPATSTRPSTVSATPTGGIRLGAQQPAYIFGISYNASNGTYKIKRNNISIASGTLSVVSNMRVFFYSDYYFGLRSIATINVGQSPFVYTPEYI